MKKKPRQHPFTILCVLALCIVLIPFVAAVSSDPTPDAVPVVSCEHPRDPVARFTHTYTASDGVPQTVQFTDTSTTLTSQPITTYRWEFGDGTTSTQKNPRHTYNTYSTSDTMYATLRVTTACGRSDEFSAGFGLECSAHTAGFTTDVSEGPAPLTVRITDTSQHAPDSATSWKYSIYSGTTVLATLNEKNPVYTFNTPGRFRIYQNLTKTCTEDIFSVSAHDINVLEPSAIVVTTTTATADVTTEVSPATTTSEVTAAETTAVVAETTGLTSPPPTSAVPPSGSADTGAPGVTGTRSVSPASAVSGSSAQGSTGSGPVPLIIAGVIILVIAGAGIYLYRARKKV